MSSVLKRTSKRSRSSISLGEKTSTPSPGRHPVDERLWVLNRRNGASSESPLLPREFSSSTPCSDEREPLRDGDVAAPGLFCQLVCGVSVAPSSALGNKVSSESRLPMDLRGAIERRFLSRLEYATDDGDKGGELRRGDDWLENGELNGVSAVGGASRLGMRLSQRARSTTRTRVRVVQLCSFPTRRFEAAQSVFLPNARGDYMCRKTNYSRHPPQNGCQQRRSAGAPPRAGAPS